MNVKRQEMLKAAESIKAICEECKSELRSMEKDLPEHDVQKLSDHRQLARNMRVIQLNSDLIISTLTEMLSGD